MRGARAEGDSTCHEEGMRRGDTTPLVGARTQRRRCMRTRCMHAQEVRAQEVCARAGGAGRRRQGSRGATHIHGPGNPRRAGGEMIMGGTHG